MVHAHTGSERSQRLRMWLASLVIVGVLAAIIGPLAVDQAKKGVDARVKSDLTAVQTAITDWMLTHQNVPHLSVTGTTVTLDGVEVAHIHAGTQLSELSGLTSSTWCLTAFDEAGKHADPPGYRYDAAEGSIETGKC